MSDKKSRRMEEISFFEHLKNWVYIPFASILGVMTTIYWRLRASDRKDAADNQEEIKTMLRDISHNIDKTNGVVAASTTNLARIDERVKTLFEQRRSNG